MLVIFSVLKSSDPKSYADSNVCWKRRCSFSLCLGKGQRNNWNGYKMTDLIAARSQMALSLAFHIVFAAIGIAMPLMMTIAEWHWLRTGQEVYLTLAKRWAKGTAILFAVGAVSGTVLS